MGRLKSGARYCVRLGRKAVAKVYRVFLARVALKLFGRPETAICHAFNAMPPTPERVVSNYCQGMVLLGKNIDGDLIWWTYPERAIITPETAHIPKRLRGYMRRGGFTLSEDEDFEAVMRACQREKWTWINEPAIDIYKQLHSMGFARSLEARQDGQLVGGLWGLEVGSTFVLMSVFNKVDRFGSIMLGTLVEKLANREWDMLDCGEQHGHFKRFGARSIPREEFVERVVHGLMRSYAKGRRQSE